MTHKKVLFSITSAVILGILATGVAISAQDRYSLKVPGGLTFSEFKGYETWQTISISHNGEMLAAILGNPAMIDAFKSGIPENGKPFPDGAKMAKIHWVAKKKESYPAQPLVAGTLHDVDLMVKDSKRFAATNGWGFFNFGHHPLPYSSWAKEASAAECAGCHQAFVAKTDMTWVQFYPILRDGDKTK